MMPESEPRRSIRSDEVKPDEAAARLAAERAAKAEQSHDFAGEQGGIY